MAELFGIVFSLLLALVGIGIIHHAYLRLRTVVKTLAATPVSPHKLKTGTENLTGPVEYEGTVVPLDDTLTTPVSETEAVFYHARAKYHSKQNAPRWRTFAYELDSTPFLIRGDNGVVGVHAGVSDDEAGNNPHNPLPVRTDERVPLDALTDRHRELLKREHGGTSLVQTLNSLTGKPLRFVEERIEPGENVYVVGSLEQDATGRPVIAADRITEHQTQGLLSDVLVSTGMILFALFLISTFLMVGLPNLLRPFA